MLRPQVLRDFTDLFTVSVERLRATSTETDSTRRDRARIDAGMRELKLRATILKTFDRRLRQLRKITFIALLLAPLRASQGQTFFEDWGHYIKLQGYGAGVGVANMAWGLADLTYGVAEVEVQARSFGLLALPPLPREWQSPITSSYDQATACGSASVGTKAWESAKVAGYIIRDGASFGTIPLAHGAYTDWTGETDNAAGQAFPGFVLSAAPLPRLSGMGLPRATLGRPQVWQPAQLLDSGGNVIRDVSYWRNPTSSAPLTGSPRSGGAPTCGSCGSAPRGLPAPTQWPRLPGYAVPHEVLPASGLPGKVIIMSDVYKYIPPGTAAELSILQRAISDIPPLPPAGVSKSALSKWKPYDARAESKAYWGVMFGPAHADKFRVANTFASRTGTNADGWYLMKYRDELSNLEYHFGYHPDSTTIILHYFK